MASLQRKKSGQYYLQWDDSTRLPRRITESLKTKEADRALYLKRKLEYEYLDGKHDPWVSKWYDRPDKNKMGSTVRELTELYIQEKASTPGTHGWAATTHATNRSRLKRLSVFVGPERSIETISAKQLQSFFVGKGEHTQKSEYTSVMAFLRWCERHGHLKAVPELHVASPQENIPEWLDDDMLKAVYEHKEQQIRQTEKHCTDTDTRWHIDAWKLAASTGLRKAEIGSLCQDAIRDDTIIVGYRHRTKSGKQRAVPMLFEAKQIVQKYIDPHYRKSDPILSGSDLLFGRQSSGIDKMSRSFSVYCRALWPDRKELSFHSLRHTFAMRYLKAPSINDPRDWRLRKLQLILGHADISTTMQYLKADITDLSL